MARTKKNTRREELLACCSGLDQAATVLTSRLIDEMIFLEGRMTELEKMPQISVNPKNPSQQRQTAAAKQLKEILQQYTNCVKIMLKVTGGEAIGEESPLRAFLRAQQLQESK